MSKDHTRVTPASSSRGKKLHPGNSQKRAPPRTGCVREDACHLVDGAAHAALEDHRRRGLLRLHSERKPNAGGTHQQTSPVLMEVPSTTLLSRHAMPCHEPAGVADLLRAHAEQGAELGEGNVVIDFGGSKQVVRHQRLAQKRDLVW